MYLVTFAVMTGIAFAQSPGNGVSKTTYASDDPIPGKKFLEKYFPVATPGDECDNDICICPAGTGGDTEWYIQQGRIYFLESTSNQRRRLRQSPGNGFGLHLVNVSNHLTTGGRSVAEVEAEFTAKLGDMSEFDSFMDFNAMLYTKDLSSYVATLKADDVPLYTATWQYQNKTWTSVFLRVATSQAIMEICSDQQQTEIVSALQGKFGASVVVMDTLEARAGNGVLDRVESEGMGLTTASSTILYPLQVNRAVSKATLAKLDDFYVTGMGTTKTTDDTGNDYAKKCYLWPGATVQVCFTQRSDSATKGNWKVGDFEKMLNTVHTNILGKTPSCGVDKWFDNHYAIDSRSADTSKILKYVENNDVIYYCSGGSLHYIFDPTGWGIQLDMMFSGAPSGCGSSSSAEVTFKDTLFGGASTLGGGTFNPACQPGTC